MTEKLFLDTNILIYASSDKEPKKSKARRIVLSEDDLVISSQVISEFISVCIQKQLLKAEEINLYVNEFMVSFDFSLIYNHTIQKALELRQKYNFAFWDCLIVATALENHCAILYTEDMQDGLLIEKTLTIRNPFK
jgi:predicted nucleic acid-binding protein